MREIIKHLAEEIINTGYFDAIFWFTSSVVLVALFAGIKHRKRIGCSRLMALVLYTTTAIFWEMTEDMEILNHYNDVMIADMLYDLSLMVAAVLAFKTTTCQKGCTK